MTTRLVISVVSAIAGGITVVVGGIHFVMMPHLTSWILSQTRSDAAQDVVGAFAVNHIGSGLLLILQGIIILYSSVRGLRLGKRWARVITLLFGSMLLILTAILYVSVPAMFLEAAAFRWALMLLAFAALLIVVPLLLYRHLFNEP
jgi:hypothetical protein